MRAEDRIRLRRMLESAESAVRFVTGRQRADLESDDMLRLALSRAIEIIGEAAVNVSEATRAAIPRIPWRDIIGMRNRLIHAYFHVNVDILWKTATEDIPPLVQTLRAELPPD